MTIPAVSRINEGLKEKILELEDLMSRVMSDTTNDTIEIGDSEITKESNLKKDQVFLGMQ